MDKEAEEDNQIPQVEYNDNNPNHGTKAYSVGGKIGPP